MMLPGAGKWLYLYIFFFVCGKSYEGGWCQSSSAIFDRLGWWADGFCKVAGLKDPTVQYNIVSSSWLCISFYCLRQFSITWWGQNKVRFKFHKKFIDKVTMAPACL